MFLVWLQRLIFCGLICSAGVSSLISLLTSAREEDQPRLNVLLCEAVVAVYVSLLIHGLGTHNSNELFRLAAHPLNNRMWAAVFGGGAKVIIKPKRPELPPGIIISSCFTNTSNILIISENPLKSFVRLVLHSPLFSCFFFFQSALYLGLSAC